MRGNPKVVQIKANLYHYRRLFGSNSYTNNITMRHIHQLRYTYDWLKTIIPIPFTLILYFNVLLIWRLPVLELKI